MQKDARSSRGAKLAPAPLLSFALLLVIVSVLAACVRTNPPTDVGNPVAPSSPSQNGEDDNPTPSQPQPTPQPSPQPPPSTTQSLTYTKDLKPIFDSDCVVCHSGSRPSAGYSMTTYAGVTRDVSPGNANSRLVVWSQPGGTMYRFWTGNASQKAAMVRQWVVSDHAAQ